MQGEAHHFSDSKELHHEQQNLWLMAYLTIKIDQEEIHFIVDSVEAFALISLARNLTGKLLRITAKGQFVECLTPSFDSDSFSITSSNYDPAFRYIKFWFEEGSTKIYFIEKKDHGLILHRPKGSNVCQINELVPMGNVPMLSILGNPKYPIPGKLFEILQLALSTKNDIDFEIFNGLKTLLTTLITHANQLDPQLFPDIATEDPVLLKRMYNKLICEIRDIGKTFTSPKVFN